MYIYKNKYKIPKKRQYVEVSASNVKKVKSYVFSLPKYEQRKYYSLLNSISNRFYGSTKSLTESELKLYSKIIKTR